MIKQDKNGNLMWFSRKTIVTENGLSFFSNQIVVYRKNEKFSIDNENFYTLNEPGLIADLKKDLIDYYYGKHFIVRINENGTFFHNDDNYESLGKINYLLNQRKKIDLGLGLAITLTEKETNIVKTVKINPFTINGFLFKPNYSKEYFLQCLAYQAAKTWFDERYTFENYAEIKFAAKEEEEETEQLQNKQENVISSKPFTFNVGSSPSERWYSFLKKMNLEFEKELEVVYSKSNKKRFRKKITFNNKLDDLSKLRHKQNFELKESFLFNTISNRNKEEMLSLLKQNFGTYIVENIESLNISRLFDEKHKSNKVLKTINNVKYLSEE